MAKKPTKVREGYRQVTRPDGQQTTVRVGSTADTGYMNRELTQPTQQSTASGSLKDLSIGLANQAGVASPTKGDGSIKDLSIGLAKGNKITQEDITRAQSGGPSLASLSAPTTTPTTPTSGGATGNGKSNQTGVGGSGYYSRYGLGKDEPVIDVPSYEEIEKDYTKSAQKEINSLYDYERDLLDEQRRANEQANRATASVSTLTGLAGSSEANIQQQKTTQQGTAELDKIRSAVQVKVQSVLSEVRKNAQDMYRYERTQAVTDATAKATLTEKTRANAQQDIALLAGSGVTMEGLKATDPDSYNYLAQSLGGDDMVKAMFTLNRPQDTILDKKIEGGKYVIAFQNPLDGKIRIESVDLGLPPQYTKTIDAGDRILAIPDGWTGDPSELITINKGLTPSQQGAGSGNQTSYGSDLDAIIGATKATISSKFGQQTFDQQIARARNEGDKINLIASVVLGKADSATKTDFTNQAVGINQIDKAIKMLDDGAKTGVLEAGAQYTFNVFGKDFDPKLAELNQLITSAIQPYRNSVTGAAWGTQEDGEYQMLFGSTKYSPAELRQRLEGVKEILASKSASALNSYVNPMNYYENPFNPNMGVQTYQLISPEGTQVEGSLSPEEYQEALNNGYTPA